MAGFAFRLGFTRPPELHLPCYVAHLTGCVLALAAIVLAARQAGRVALGHALAAAVLVGYALLGTWVARPGTRAIGCSLIVGPTGTAGIAGAGAGGFQVGCGTMFRAGAVICLAAAGGAVLLAAWARRAPSPP